MQGVDHLANMSEVFPTTTMAAHVHTGESSFDVAIDPANQGCMLRRTLDLQFANQRASVSVRSSATGNQWADAGVFFTAGSNTVVFSDPRNETAPPKASEVVQTSNRRFRQEVQH